MQRLDWDPQLGRLEIRFPYDEELVKLVRGFPGRRWHAGERFWSVPGQHCAEAARTLIDAGFDASEGVLRLLDGTAPLPGGAEASAAPATGNPASYPAPARSAPGGEPLAVSEGLPADTITVSMLNERVRDVLHSALPGSFWLAGEVLGYDRNAHKQHIYFQLAEKEEGDDKPRAVVTVVLFERVRRAIQPLLEGGEEPIRLRDGVRIRLRGRVDLYSPTGSYQVLMEEIDPNFTLGEIALRRERILAEIRRRGLERRNLSRPFPRPALRLALVTSVESDAYNDVLSELGRSGYAFEVEVFDCHVQGKRLEGDVLRALAHFAEQAAGHDLLAIVRGGGSRTDLMGFDSLPIAEAAALHPLKVLIGVGHQRDLGVLDFIAHSEKTPTAVAQKLVALAREEEAWLAAGAERLCRLGSLRLDSAREALARGALHLRRALELRLEQGVAAMRLAARGLVLVTARRTERARIGIEQGAAQVARGARRRLARARERLALVRERLGRAARARLERQRERLEGRALGVRGADPGRLLARGYAWLRSDDGLSLKSVHETAPGRGFTARLSDGELDGRVEKILPADAEVDRSAE